MKRTIAALTALAICFSLAACGGGEEKPPAAVVPEGYVRYDVGDWNGRTLDGFGGQLDTHIYKGDWENYDGYSDEELAELYRRCREMNLQNIRTQIFPEWYERANDNDDPDDFDADSPNVDFDSVEMRQMCELLDFCEQANVSVDLSFYGCNALFRGQNGIDSGSWLGAAFTSSWTTAPKTEGGFPGYEEYAESVYACLDYLLNVKKYTCVNEFSIYPEPNLSFVLADGTVSYTGFIKLCKEVDEKLRKEGIRDKIDFSGPADASTSVAQYAKYIGDLDGVLDRGTVSTYRFVESDSNETFYNYGQAMVEVCDETGVPWGLAEFGTKSTYESDPEYFAHMDSYERALFMARYMINLVNAGCTNMKVWTLCDVNYGGYVMAMGLWKFRDEDWKARPAYYSWSLITRCTDKGSKVYPVLSEDPNVCVIAFQLPDGSWSYMMANDSAETKKVSVVNPAASAPAEMDLYLVSESTIPASRAVQPLAPAFRAERESGCYNVEIPANSFVVLSNKTFS